MFLRRLVHWPSIDIQVKFYGDRPRGTPSSEELNTSWNGIATSTWYARKCHPSYISSNCSNDLVYQLKIYIYITVIRPVSEYACTVWNHNLTATLSDQLESYQKRALRIIYGDQIKGVPYQNALFLANLESLKDRRIKLSQSFFKKVLSTDSCLHTLLPPECNNEIFSKLRNPSKYPIPYSRTKKYQSFLNYALAKFQNSM